MDKDDRIAALERENAQLEAVKAALLMVIEVTDSCHGCWAHNATKNQDAQLKAVLAALEGEPAPSPWPPNWGNKSD